MVMDHLITLTNMAKMKIGLVLAAGLKFILRTDKISSSAYYLGYFRYQYL